MQKPTTPKRLSIISALTHLHTAKDRLAGGLENQRLADAVKSMTSVLAIYFALSLEPTIQPRHQPAVDEFFEALAELESVTYHGQSR